MVTVNAGRLQSIVEQSDVTEANHAPIVYDQERPARMRTSRAHGPNRSKKTKDSRSGAAHIGANGETSSERKIDRIEERLTKVVGLLENLTSNHNQGPLDRVVHGPLAAGLANGHENTFSNSTPFSSIRDREGSPGYNTSTTPATLAGNTEFEGASSMTAHADFANSYLAHSVSFGPLKDFHLELDDTLKALRDLVSQRDEVSTTKEHRYAPTTTSACEARFYKLARPSPNMAMASIRLAQDVPKISCFHLCGLISTQDFTDYVLKTLFSANCSDADLIITYAGLCWLYEELSCQLTDQELGEHLQRADLRKESLSCRTNLEKLLSALPLQLPCNMDYITALVFACHFTIENSRASHSWTLISSATQMCVSSGYHRFNHVEGDPESERSRKIWLFWNVYIIEKGLSLRLGRPSCIADWDITVPVPDSGLGDHIPWGNCTKPWVQLAHVQGRCYEDLYSPAALEIPDNVRAVRAQTLFESTKKVINSIEELEAGESQRQLQSHTTFGLMQGKVLCYAVATLILRAMPKSDSSTGTFTDECVSSARTALLLHEKCLAMIEPQDGLGINLYIQWTIHYAPFIPFIVLFCRVIETMDMADLERLHSFVTSLEHAAKLCKMTASAQRLFHILCNIANRYIEIKTSATQPSMSDEFNAYLHALGFVPGLNPNILTTQDIGATGATGTAGAAGLVSGAKGGNIRPDTQREVSAQGTGPLQQDGSLGDWFYNNQQMMGLLEENFNYFTS
ncbi:hypothetical protein TruAng_000944 [Truncatella angustata]|nr:hypothetical protein TruAng_000944 [Truncatella angustata]